MSSTPIHSDNAAQAEYWNSAVGRRWVDRQEMQDAVLRPVDGRLLASASPQMGERVIDVGCGCGATTIEFASARANARRRTCPPASLSRTRQRIPWRRIGPTLSFRALA